MWGRCAVAGAPSPVLQLCRSAWSYAALLLLCMILFSLLCSVWSASGLLCVIRFSCSELCSVLAPVYDLVFAVAGAPLWSIAACVLLFGAGLRLQCFSFAALPEAMQHTCSCVIFFSCLALFLKLCSMCALCVSVAAPCDVQHTCSAALCSIDFFINTLSIPSQYSLKRFSCLAPDLLPALQQCRSEWITLYRIHAALMCSISALVCDLLQPACSAWSASAVAVLLFLYIRRK